MKKNRLLMVEDSASLAAIYMSYLADTELDVRIVDTLAKARQEVECFQPDVVLLDIELPDGQGLDLLRNPPEIR